MEDFDTFWRAYPRKMKKGDARKAWGQVSAIRPHLPFLLAALDRARASDQWRKDGGQFVPYPATWLRGECWEDSYEIEVDATGNWWDTASGIVAKAREVGVAISEYEPIPVLREKVKAALNRGGLRVVG